MKRLINFSEFLKIQVESAGKAWSCGLGEKWLGLRVRLNSNDGSNGCDIDNRRWSCVVHIVTGIVWTLIRAPEMLMVTVRGMMPWAMPPIGISMGLLIVRVMLKLWIWSGLGAQGVEGQDKAHHQDNAQPSIQVHSLTLPKKFANRIC